MLVHAIGNAPSAQFVTPSKEESAAPVLRDKVFGLPVDRDILFTNDGNDYQAGIEKRQRKWIVKLSFLKAFLLSGERIIRITPARSPIDWHVQLVTGGFFLGMEKAFLVFTSFRILHIPTRSNYAYRQSIAQVRYRDIRRIHLRWRTLVIEYKNGRTERFSGLALRERKKIKQLIPALPLVKQALQPVGRRHLCPRCSAVLSERKMRCRRCELAFKSKWVAGLMALLFPGGGYFYARLIFPGLVFFILEGLLLGLAAAIGASVVPLEIDRRLLLGGIVLVGAGLKAIGWVHLGHFIDQYIPRKARLGRWSPAPAGQQAAA
jgi:hypothetical protein